MIDKIKNFVARLQSNGIPLFFIKDYATGKPSITFTMTIVSFVLCVLAVIGKTDHSKIFEDIDYSETSNLLIISLGGYLGRKFQSNGKEATIEQKEEK